MIAPALMSTLSPTLLFYLLLLVLIVRYRAHTRVYSLIQYWIGASVEPDVRSRDPPFSVMFRDPVDSDWESGVEFDIR